jgi:hypothetical protein
MSVNGILSPVVIISTVIGLYRRPVVVATWYALPFLTPDRSSLVLSCLTRIGIHRQNPDLDSSSVTYELNDHVLLKVFVFLGRHDAVVSATVLLHILCVGDIRVNRMKRNG